LMVVVSVFCSAMLAMAFFLLSFLNRLLLVSSAQKTGRGGGIRTPKFGFGDRQFNR
jgi:hypothetical protein